MKERPILFSGAMVRALLAGTKTQTRRVVKPGNLGPGGLPTKQPTPDWNSAFYGPGMWSDGLDFAAYCPYGLAGDRLWVRETFMDLGACYLYRADASAEAERALAAPRQPWRPAIHMPRAASRITLEVTGVRVERLQSITNRDALAEGIVSTHGGYGLPDGSHFHCEAPSISYTSLFESINGPGSVEADPWVWVIEFKRAA